MNGRSSQPPGRAPASRGSSNRVLGGVLLGAVLLLFSTDLPIDELLASQNQFDYKLVTGALLWVYVAFQWLLAFARIEGMNKIAKFLFVPHQTLGVLGPVFFYAHAARWGFGYLLALSGVFFANLALGLCQPRSAPRARRLLPIWLVIHIALSIVLVVLAGYHTWQAFYYE